MSNTHASTKRPSFLTVKIILIVASGVAVLFGLFGLYAIYTNNKTDGLNNGQITVDSCKEIDWSWRIYSCSGSYFSTGGGMIERSNVSVKVFGGELKQGAIVEDVYPPTPGSAETTDYFVTGRERASVTYNIPSLILVFFGALLPILTIAFIFLAKSSRILHT